MASREQHLTQIKRELAFISKAINSGYVDEETICEINQAIREARAALEAHELSLQPETEDETLAA